MDKSAQGLSLNTIIIGAIVLIVLVVLIGLFTGFFGKFTPAFTAATEKGCAGAGYEKMVGDCSLEATTYKYEQVYARFAEGTLAVNEVCCKSSCKILSGRCETGAGCASGSRLPQGDGGCDAGSVCCG